MGVKIIHMTSTQSYSPISGNTYEISDAEDHLLTEFIKKHSGKKIVVVQGLGFVGTAMSLVVANSTSEDYAVIGVDLPNTNSYWKIGDINSGICPIISSDKNVNIYFNQAKAMGNLYATSDKRAYSFADIIIVDINLDVSKHKDVDGKLTSFEVQTKGFSSAIKDIGNFCKESVLVLVETTVPPGTCSQIVKPIIDSCLKKRGLSNKNYSLGHSYERVMPGPNYINSIKNFYRVYSGINNKSSRAVEDFLKSIISTSEFPLTKLKNTQSTEMAKVLENSYRAMNIAFIVEWSRFAENAGVDLYQLVDAIRLRPTHSNLMYPGIGVGGYCLTKDPIMASWSSEFIFNQYQGLELSKRAVEINDRMPIFAYQFFKNFIAPLTDRPSKIAILGIAYGPGIGDTRYSPVEPFVRALLDDDYNLFFHDPYVKYWEEMSCQVNQNIEDVLSNQPSFLVITTRHSFYTDNDLLYNAVNLISNKPIIFDTVGLLDEQKLSPHYKLGKNYFVIGIGS
jgi:UDP-N-acetyl-D-glucosamine dehydrogenase